MADLTIEGGIFYKKGRIQLFSIVLTKKDRRMSHSISKFRSNKIGFHGSYKTIGFENAPFKKKIHDHQRLTTTFSELSSIDQL